MSEVWGGEINQIKLGSVVAEVCNGCHGIFLDYNELVSPSIKRLDKDDLSSRRDIQQLDQMKIKCPKCNVQMDKKKHVAKGGIVLDMCPHCKGIWFDQGELSLYQQKRPFYLKPKKIYLELTCADCNIDFNYASVKERTEGIPLCPNCGKSLSFKGLEEMLVPRLPEKAKESLLLLAIIMFVACVVSFILLREIRATIIVTFTFGLILGLYYLLVVVYGVLVMSGPRYGSFVKLKDPEEDYLD